MKKYIKNKKNSLTPNFWTTVHRCVRYIISNIIIVVLTKCDLTLSSILQKQNKTHLVHNMHTLREEL